jgi:hypothetical protein
MSKLKPNEFTLPSGEVMTERPLLFQTEMVQAILEDRKTQTRRTVKLDTGQLESDSAERLSQTYFMFKENDLFVAGRNCPYGKPGDLIWVRETWESVPVAISSIYSAESTQVENRIKFKADFVDSFERWKPSIHMPKAASRIWLMVESIGVERVQDINQANARHEGIESHYDGPRLIGCKNYLNEGPRYLSTSCLSFASLWISINGLDSWKSNPWVWVIKFRVVSKTGRPTDEVIWENYSKITSTGTTDNPKPTTESTGKEAKNV